MAQVTDLRTRKQTVVYERFLINVDYTKTIGQMVEACELGIVDRDVNDDNLQALGEGVVEFNLDLFRINRSMKRGAVLTAMRRKSLVPCRIEHLLALSAQYPGVQRERKVVCLGSSWKNADGFLRVAFIDFVEDMNKHRLGAYRPDRIWGDECLFAAI